MKTITKIVLTAGVVAATFGAGAAVYAGAKKAKANGGVFRQHCSG